MKPQLNRLESRDCPTPLPAADGLTAVARREGYVGPVSASYLRTDGPQGEGLYPVIYGDAGNSSRLAVVDPVTLAVFRSAYAFEPSARVGAGDVVILERGGREPSLLAVAPRPGSGGSDRVVILDDGLQPVASFYAFHEADTGYRGGVKLNASNRDADADGDWEVVAVSGPGMAPTLAAIEPHTGAVITRYPIGPAEDLSGGYATAPALLGEVMRTSAGRVGIFPDVVELHGVAVGAFDPRDGSPVSIDGGGPWSADGR